MLILCVLYAKPCICSRKFLSLFDLIWMPCTSFEDSVLSDHILRAWQSMTSRFLCHLQNFPSWVSPKRYLISLPDETTGYAIAFEVSFRYSLTLCLYHSLELCNCWSLGFSILYMHSVWEVRHVYWNTLVARKGYMSGWFLLCIQYENPWTGCNQTS